MIQAGKGLWLFLLLWLMSGQCVMLAHPEGQEAKKEPFHVADYMMSGLYRFPDTETFSLPHWWNGLSVSTYWNPKMLNAQVEYQGWETNSFGLGLTKDFSRSNALRWGYTYQGNRHELTMDFLWNLSNHFGGYDPNREWEWLTTFGVSGGLARYLDDGSMRKFYGGQIGLQVRHTLSPFVSLYIEPQYKAVSPLYDSKWEEGNIVDDGLSLQVGLITRLSSPWRQGGYGHQAHEVLSWIYGVGNRLFVPAGLEENHLTASPRRWFVQLLGGVQVVSPWHTLSSTHLHPLSLEMNVGRHLNSIYDVQAGLYHQDVEITSIEGSQESFGMRLEGSADLLRAIWPASYQHGVGWRLGGGLEFGRVNASAAANIHHHNHLSPTLSSQLRMRLSGPLWFVAQGRMEMAPIGQDRLQIYAHAGLHYDMPPVEKIRALVPDWMRRLAKPSTVVGQTDAADRLWYAQLLGGVQVISPWHTLSGTRLRPYSFEMNVGRRINGIYGVQAGLYSQDVEITSMEGAHEAFGLRVEGTADLLRALWPASQERGVAWTLGGGFEVGRVTTEGEISARNRVHLSPTLSSQLRMRLFGPLWLIAQGRMEMAPIGQDRMQVYAHAGLHCDVPRIDDIHVRVPEWMRRMSNPSSVAQQSESDQALWYAQLLGGVQVISPWHTLSGTRLQPYSLELNVGRHLNSIYGIQAGLYHQDVEITSMEGSHEAFGLRVEGTADLLGAIWPISQKHGFGWTLGGGLEVGRVNTIGDASTRNRNHVSPTLSTQLQMRLFGPLWMIAQGRMEMAPIGQDRMQVYAHAGLHYEIPRLQDVHISLPQWKPLPMPQRNHDASWYVQLLAGAQIVSPWHTLSETRLSPYSLELNIGRQFTSVYGIQAGLYHQDVEITSLDGSHEAFGLRLEGTADLLHAIWRTTRNKGIGWTLGGGIEAGRVNTILGDNHLSPTLSSQLRMRLNGALWLIAQGRLDMAPVGQDRLQAYAHMGLHYAIRQGQNGRVDVPSWMRRLSKPATNGNDSTSWYAQLLGGMQVISPWHNLSGLRFLPYSFELNVGRHFNSIYGVQAGFYSQDVEITALDGSHEAFGLRLEGTADLLHAIWPSTSAHGLGWTLGGGMEFGKVNTTEGASVRNHNHLSPTVSSQLRVRLKGPLWLIAQGRMEMAPIGQDRMQVYAHAGLHYSIPQHSTNRLVAPEWMRRLAAPSKIEKQSEEQEPATWFVQLLGGAQVVSPWHNLSSTRLHPYSFELNAGKHLNRIYGIQAGLYHQDIEITSLEGSHKAIGMRVEGTADLLGALSPSLLARGMNWTLGGGLEFGRVSTIEGISIRNHLSPTLSSQVRMKVYGPLWFIAQGRIEMAPIGQDRMQVFGHVGLHYQFYSKKK